MALIAKTSSRKLRWSLLAVALAASAALKLFDRPSSAAPSVEPIRAGVEPVTPKSAAVASMASVRMKPDRANTATQQEELRQIEPTVRPRPIIDEGAIDVFAVPSPAAAEPALNMPVPQRLAALGGSASGARKRNGQTMPPPVPAVVQPPVPAVADAARAAPVFPYIVIGRYEIDGNPIVFLNSPQGVIAVQIGKTLDTGWRIDAITDHALTLTFIPNNQATTVALVAIR